MWIAVVLFIASWTALNAQIPSGSVPATPNTVYYAGGQCEFFDATGKKLLSVNAAEAVWSCSPAKAAWASVTPKSGGYYEFPNYTANAPRVSRDEMLRSFWLGDTIYKEALVLSGVGSSSKLLYTPKKVLSVTNYNGSRVFTEGADYAVSGRNVTQVSAGPSQTYVAKQGQRGNGTPNGLINIAATSWTYVTYIPDRSDWNPMSVWNGKAILLPKTMQKLRQGKPLTVQALGMSLTAGLNVSGFAGDPKNFPPTDPYMRSYVDLFCEQLQAIHGSQVTLFNASCGGKTVAWADQYCRQLVNPNMPDLVIIDMGMNDIWGTTTAAAFRASMESTIQKIRSDCPDAEFMLIGNMLPDVTATGAPKDGETWMYEFLRQLNALETSGIAVFDMTSMSKSLYDRKGPACFTSNSLHPNDYMARWYAQGMIELLSDGATSITDDAQNHTTLAVSVHPNPVAYGRAHISVLSANSDSNAPLMASVYTSSGERVLQFPIATLAHTFSIDELCLASGVYSLVVNHQKRQAQTTFVVHR